MLVKKTISIGTSKVIKTVKREFLLYVPSYQLKKLIESLHKQGLQQPLVYKREGAMLTLVK